MRKEFEKILEDELHNEESRGFFLFSPEYNALLQNPNSYLKVMRPLPCASLNHLITELWFTFKVDRSKKITSDYVVMAIGIDPETSVAKASGLEVRLSSYISSL